MLKNTGVPTDDLIKSAYPNEARRKKGPFAVIECFQCIPCNPCQTACPRNAIFPMQDINDLPKTDFNKCNGCGICAFACPGQAIFMIDETYSKMDTLVSIPYEFVPLPNIGDIVIGLNREGKEVCSATVHSIKAPNLCDRTPLITLIVPKEWAMHVRFFKQRREDWSCECETKPASKSKNKSKYVCRCEEISEEDIKRLINQGHTTLNEIKIASRAGMGACQGRTCRQLIMSIIAKETGINPQDMPMVTFRPPTKPIKMSILAEED
ncbi:MAG: (2Fe-2S)-binding protein [Firmicutes bacterium]|nr:(2Fe-2S)-binding protein [Bacillota bacterium]